MTQQPQKKAWVAPRLIVLVRSKTEEAVLTGCKGASGFGECVEDGACIVGHTGPCAQCQSVTAS